MDVWRIFQNVLYSSIGLSQTHRRMKPRSLAVRLLFTISQFQATRSMHGHPPTNFLRIWTKNIFVANFCVNLLCSSIGRHVSQAHRRMKPRFLGVRLPFTISHFQATRSMHGNPHTNFLRIWTKKKFMATFFVKLLCSSIGLHVSQVGLHRRMKPRFLGVRLPFTISQFQALRSMHGHPTTNFLRIWTKNKFKANFLKIFMWFKRPTCIPGT